MFKKYKALKNEVNENGFTFIELLVVILIIGILAAIAIPVFRMQRAIVIDESITMRMEHIDSTMYSNSGGNYDKKLLGKLSETKYTGLSGAKVSITSSYGGYCIGMYHPDARTYDENEPAKYDTLTGGYDDPTGACNNSPDYGLGGEVLEISKDEKLTIPDNYRIITEYTEYTDDNDYNDYNDYNENTDYNEETTPVTEEPSEGRRELDQGIIVFEQYHPEAGRNINILHSYKVYGVYSSDPAKEGLITYEIELNDNISENTTPVWLQLKLGDEVVNTEINFINGLAKTGELPDKYKPVMVTTNPTNSE